MLWISVSLMGCGFMPPRKPVIFGRVLDQVEGLLVEIHLDEHVAREELARVDRFWPLTSSTTVSVGISTSPNFSFRPAWRTRSISDSRALFSCPE